MAKDYAKSARPSSKKAKQSHSKMWAFTLLLALLFVGGLFYLKQHEALSVFKNSVQHHASKQRAQQKKQQETKPRFEFYTILPKMNVDDSQAQNQQDKSADTTGKPTPAAQQTKSVEKAAATQQANKTEKTAPVRAAIPVKTVAASKYIIQVASFRNFAEADRLKAEMLMLGQSVDVKAFNNKGAKWYRVQAGPYPSLAAAQKAQQQLKANNIKAIVRKAG